MPFISPTDPAALNKFFSTDEPILGFENVRSPSGNHNERFLPFSVQTQTRDMQAGVFSQGGALVTSPAISDQVIPYLRAKSVCARLGAEMMVNLKPPTQLPILASDFQASWVGEFQNVAAQDLNVMGALFSPHKLVASLTSSKLLDVQSNPNFGATLAAQGTGSLMQKHDFAALVGSGGAMPIGVLNQKGIPSFSFAGAASWAKIVAAEQTVGNANADGLSLGWAQSWDTRARWKQIPRSSGSSFFLQDDRGYVNGYPSAATTELNSANAGDRIVFGNWSDMKLAIFGPGVFVLKNPYTLSKAGEDSWVFTLYADAGVTRPQSFLISTDSGAQ